MTLVYDEQGEPMLVVENDKADSIAVIDQTKPKTDTKTDTVSILKEKPSHKWSPKVREQSKEESINTLPLEVIAPYIHYDHMFSQEQLDQFPYVIGSDEGYKSTINGFKVYVNRELELAKSYAIYEKSEEIIDPETDEALGYSVKLVGTAKAINIGDMLNKVPSTLMVNSANREIHTGSYVVPVNNGQLLPAHFSMQAVDASIRGSIISSSTLGREFGKLEVVMINRGSENQVHLGDVFAIKRKSPSVVETADGPKYMHETSRFNRIGDTQGDFNMPEEVIGQMMVFKLYQKTSMALILTTSKPARLNDAVTAP